jgi:sugar O-acyltransferase (sialic acid O-acetyltransferase NeuD family)
VKPIVIYGAGGMAREVAQLIHDINQQEEVWDLLGFLSDDPESWKTDVGGLPVLGGHEWLRRTPHCAVALGVGSPATKLKLVGKMKGAAIGFPILRHPSVVISRSVYLGRGTIITAGCILTVDIKLGDFVTINLACTISHDCRLGDYVTIAPGVNVSGNVLLNEGCDVGTGSTIIQGLTVGEWSIIGAGAVVVRELPANCTAVGVPAKSIKQREVGWQTA